VERGGIITPPVADGFWSEEMVDPNPRMRSLNYNAYKEFDVDGPNVAAAREQEAAVKRRLFSLARHNCMNDTHDVLSAYGGALPNPGNIADWRPNDWFRAAPGDLVTLGGEEQAAEDAMTNAGVQFVEDEPPAVRRSIRMFGGLQALDAAALQALNRLPHTPNSDRYLSVVSDLGRGVGWVAICAGLAWRDGSWGRRAGARAIVAMLVANFLAQGPMKSAFGRRRPIHSVTGHVVVGARTLDTSFPSGHSASSFAAATSLARAYPSYAAVFFALAAGVGFSRVYLGHHFPSDVVGGAAVGAGIGALASALARADPCRGGG
jgi:membrane-associated phospholipid phosphatase